MENSTSFEEFTTLTRENIENCLIDSSIPTKMTSAPFTAVKNSSGDVPLESMNGFSEVKKEMEESTPSDDTMDAKHYVDLAKVENDEESVVKNDDDDDEVDLEKNESISVASNNDDSDEFIPDEESEASDDDDYSESQNSSESSGEEYSAKKGSKKKSLSKKNAKSRNAVWEKNPDLYLIRRSGRPKNENQNYSTRPNLDFQDGDDSFMQGIGKKNQTYANFVSGSFVNYRFTYKNQQMSDEDFSVKSQNSYRKAPSKKAARPSAPENVAESPIDTSNVRYSTRKAAVNVSYKYDEEDEEDDFLASDDGAEETVEYTPQSQDLNLESIEKIVGTKKETRDGRQVQLYHIKWQGKSYLHNTWETEEELKSKEIRGHKKLSNYIQNKRTEERYIATATPEDVEYYQCQQEMDDELLETHFIVERIISLKDTPSDGAEYTQQVLCKWVGLPYSECTWEDTTLVSGKYQQKIDEYLDRESSLKKPNPKCIALRHRPKFVELKEQPSYLGSRPDMQLRDYQLDGLNWLGCSWCRNNSSILADEMGLGKTIQSISFLSYLFHEHNVHGPFLVVVPLSTITAWQRELESWCPEMNSILYLGDTQSRATIRQYEFYMDSSGGQKLKFNVLLTTYEIILMDQELLGQIRWASLLVDEAHRLKNSESQLHLVLNSFHTNHRLLITGTPLQNSLKELYSLLTFLMPNFFPSWELFEREYDELKSQETVKKLHENLEPFLLRRIKKDVEKSLPAKVERILRVDMSEKQKEYYRYILTKNYRALSKGNKQKASLLNIMVELKKCCNHPDLIVQPDHCYSRADLKRMIMSSGKMNLLDKLLRKLKDTGHRVLIFSQMVKFLDILAEYLQLKGYMFQRLDGGVRGEQRKQAMDHFNAPGSKDFCFILSTRAGGLGINLATADTVIIFDSDWNPQNDLQAEARAHRIGQKNAVNIYRLITKNSVEETIIERAKQKMILDHVVIQRMDTTGRTVLSKPTTNSSVPFDKDELDAILKFGAQDLFKENGSCQEEQEMDLDEILSRAETRENPDAPATMGDEFLSQFKVANFSTASDKSWDEIIPQEEKEKIEEAERQKQAMDLYLPPRQRRAVQKLNVGYDSEDDSSLPASSRKKEDSHKKGASAKSRKPPGGGGKDFDDGSFTCAEVKALVRALRKFGDDEGRISEIMQESGLSKNRSPEEVVEFMGKLVKDCASVVDHVLEGVDPGEGGKPKGAVYVYGNMSLSAVDFLNRIKELDILKKRIKARGTANFRPSAGVKSVQWDCKWGTKDDGNLLVGIHLHGFGNWELIRDDPVLGLTNKILVSGGSLSPQGIHLLRRGEQLLKLFRLEEESKKAVASSGKSLKGKSKQPKSGKKPVEKPVKKSPRRASSRRTFAEVDSEEELEEDAALVGEEEEVEEEEGENKRRVGRETSHSLEEEGGAEAMEEELDPKVNATCKKYMRPVKSTLLKIEKLAETSAECGWTVSVQADRLKEYLVVIGDHIERLLHANISNHDERSVMRADLWHFTSKFSTVGDGFKLRRIYKMAKDDPSGQPTPDSSSALVSEADGNRRSTRESNRSATKMPLKKRFMESVGHNSATKRSRR